MKSTIIKCLSFLTLVLLFTGARAQDELHLSVYFSPASHDVAPGSDNVAKYSIYLTEPGSQTLADIQTAVLEDPSALSNYVYICHAVFWNTECSQYATLDMVQDATDETILDGRYECTANTVAVIVYEDATNREVLVIPGADDYFFEFFDDWEQPGTGWSSGEGGGEPPVAIADVDQNPFFAYCSSHNVVVRGAQGSMVELYNEAGRRLFAGVASSDMFATRVLPTGVYIVRVNGKSKKVLVR